MAEHDSSTRKPLTSVQRRALGLAQRKGGAATGTVKGTIRVQVANVLATCEWVTVTNGTVLITRAGRAKLNEPIPEDPDVYLRVGDGLTTNRKDAIVTELILDAHTLAPFWKEQALRNKAATQDARKHARKLSRGLSRLPAPVVTRWVCPGCGGPHASSDCEAAA